MAIAEKTFGTSFRIPFGLRARIDALRSRRAKRDGGHPPKFGEIVIEALEMVLAADRKAAK